MDYTAGLGEKDAAFTFALDITTGYRMEALGAVSLVPDSETDVYLQSIESSALWNADKKAAREFGKLSNADFLIIGRHALSPSGGYSCEFRIVYLALDDTVRTQRLQFALPASEAGQLQKKVFERLLSQLPMKVPAKFWASQNTIDSNSAFFKFGEGIRQVSTRHADAGLAEFKKILSSNKYERDVNYYLGRYYATRQFDYERAVFHLREIIKKNTKDFGAHYWLGFTYYLRANYPEAVKEFEKAESIDPDSVEIYLLLGTLYQDTGNYAAVISSYKQALKLVPYRASIWYSLTSVLSLTGKTDEALKALQRTLELDRKAFYNLARSDSDLAQLRKTDAYRKLMETYKP